jgi:hypothetical protein
MNGKVARHLRKVAVVNTVGKSAQETRKVYKRLKNFYYLFTK